MNTKIVLARAFILPAALIASITIGTKCNSDKKKDNVNQPTPREVKNDPHEKTTSNGLKNN